MVNKLFGVINEKVYATTDLGTSWVLSNTGIPEYPALTSLILSTGDTLYASVFINDGVFFGYKVYRSINNGNSWAPTGPGIPSSEAPFALAAIGKEVYAGLGVYGSVYRTVNVGQTWDPANIGLPNVDVRTIFPSGNNLFAGSLSNAGVHISTDGGNTWIPSGNGLPDEYKTVNAFTQNPNYLFTGMWYRGVYRSSDNGQNWQYAANGLSAFGLFVNALTIKGNYVFAGTEDGVFRTSNNGNNWVIASPVAGSGHPEINTITSLNNYVFAGTPVNGVFRSADNGATWKSINNGLNGSPVYTIIVRGNDLILGANGVFISHDNGDTWIPKKNGMQLGGARTVAAKGDTIVAAIYDVTNLVAMGISKSTDNGANWKEFDRDVKPFAVRSLAISGSNVYAGTENESIWKSSLTGEGCSAISATSTSNITATSAVLNWNIFGSAESYQIQYGKDTSHVSTINTNNTSYALNNLQPDTKYGWRVRANCGQTYSAWSRINIFKTKASSITANELKIYPNPTKGQFTLTLTDALLENSIITITDGMGQIVYRNTLNKNQTSYHISLGSKVIDGIYRVTVTSKEKKIRQQLIIQH